MPFQFAAKYNLLLRYVSSLTRYSEVGGNGDEIFDIYWQDRVFEFPVTLFQFYLFEYISTTYIALRNYVQQIEVSTFTRYSIQIHKIFYKSDLISKYTKQSRELHFFFFPVRLSTSLASGTNFRYYFRCRGNNRMNYDYTYVKLQSMVDFLVIINNLQNNIYACKQKKISNTKVKFALAWEVLKENKWEPGRNCRKKSYTTSNIYASHILYK